MIIKIKLKACYFMKVGLVDLSMYGGKIKFEFWLSRQRRAGQQNQIEMSVSEILNIGLAAAGVTSV